METFLNTDFLCTYFKTNFCLFLKSFDYLWIQLKLPKYKNRCEKTFRTLWTATGEL